MEMSYYQKQTKTSIQYPKNKALEYLGLGLASEAGEVCSVLKKNIRDGKPLDSLESELGDVLWYIARIADELKLNLGIIGVKNLKKLQDRKNKNIINGDGHTDQERLDSLSHI